MMTHRATLKTLLCCFGILLFAYSCAPWNQIAVPQAADSSAKLGTIRVTKTNDQKVILTNAAVVAGEIIGMSDAVTSAQIHIPLDSVSKVEKERSKTSQGFLLYRNYLVTVSLIAIVIGAAIYH